MRTTARAVVIGGGIGGLSALYHLTLEGWTDVMLLERDELTSGTTWHSAAQVTSFGAIQVMLGLKKHSIALYRELADDPDYPVGYHYGDGGLRLAGAEWHMDGYRHFLSVARAMDVDFELLDPAECKRRHPLIATDGLLGALWDPTDGDIDPAQLCQALAFRARRNGAEIHRTCPATAITETTDGWRVETPAGAIDCEHVVNAGGYRCNEIAAMMGVHLPVVSMEHQYFVTEAIPEIEALDQRVPLLRCPSDDFYQRQEKDGLLIGFYEQDCRTWGLDGIDPDFTMALCPDDLDRVTDVLDGAIGRLPCLASAGIKRIVNGPITYTPDGVPLVGRIPGKRGAWCITGLRAGLGEGGGHGWLLAQEMVHGEACYDTWALDPRRFGDHANKDHTAAKAIEDYRNEFRFHRPHEHRPAGRPAKTTPLTDTLACEGAAFGAINGWERALYFSPDPGFVDDHSFARPAWHDIVAAEVAAVTGGVGLMEVSGFARFSVAGDGADDWFDALTCSRLPRGDGRIALAYVLNDHGHVQSEFTVARLAPDRFVLGSAAAAHDHDLDLLTQAAPPPKVAIEPLTERITTLVVAGPNARALLADVAPATDWSHAAFPWLRCRLVEIAGQQVMAMTVSYSGEDAVELHVPNVQLSAVDTALVAAGAPHGLRRFGALAAESMRIEKGYLHWKADLLTEFDPFETGLDRFVNLEKPRFRGRDAIHARMEKKSTSAPAATHRLVSLRTTDGGDAPVHPGEAVCASGSVVGSVTSAAWGHRVGENLALTFIAAEALDAGAPLTIYSGGSDRRVEVVPSDRVDPTNSRVRGTKKLAA
ncbi:MAG: FAD-dependent oxidoreductase [Pseudomonadota bacterium]